MMNRDERNEEDEHFPNMIMAALIFKLYAGMLCKNGVLRSV